MGERHAGDSVNTMDLERREVHFSGRVQGVGFRYTTKRLATRFAVTGFVRNLANGKVHLVVEGDSTEIDALLRAVQSKMTDNIEDIQSVRSDHQGTFESFEITY